MSGIIRKIILLAVVAALFTGCDHELARDLSPKDANRVVTIMAQAGVDVTQTMQSGGTVKLSVDAAQQKEAIRLLTTYRLLPEHSNDKDNDSFFPSPGEQRRKLENELTRRIEDTLKSFAGMLDVRIFFHSPEADGAKEQRSASVVIQATDSFSLPIADIQRLIAGASGIAPQQVEVLIKKESLKSVDNHPVVPLAVPASSQKFDFNETVAQPGLACLMVLVGVFCLWRYRRNLATVPV